LAHKKRRVRRRKLFLSVWGVARPATATATRTRQRRCRQRRRRLNARLVSSVIFVLEAAANEDIFRRLVSSPYGPATATAVPSFFYVFVAVVVAVVVVVIVTIVVVVVVYFG